MSSNGGPQACIIGHPVAHSRSPMLHGYWLEHYHLAGNYGRADVAPAEIDGFLAGLADAGYAGANVTVPHKTAAFRAAVLREPAAEATGAVNTLWFDKGRLCGDNSDVGGFLANLDEGAPGWDNGERALVLGAGGAARGIVYALRSRGLAVDVVNRTEAAAEALANYFGNGVQPFGWDRFSARLPHADLVVNTTALGMTGKPTLDLPLDGLRADGVVHDIVYVPLETTLLAEARRRGNRVVDGLGMLLHQAVPGFERWFGMRPVVTAELRALVEADIGH